MNQEEETVWGRQLDSDTVVGDEVSSHETAPRVLGVTILAHPDVGRVGERAVLPALESGGESHLSRGEPYFAAPGSDVRRPLADPYLSRKPIRLLALERGGVRLDCSDTRTPVSIDNGTVRSHDMTLTELEQGVAIVLANRHALLLHRMPMPPEQSGERFGLVGHSAAMVRLQSEVQKVADSTVPVLLRGETGTGKELAARAIHRLGPRRDRPFVAVNVGAIPPNLAAAELFGAEKGAFTSADRRRAGHFEMCDGGTLFLDEIGEMPLEVQVTLLRVLEYKEVQPVGSERSRQVDVRLIAASDADLESASQLGSFKAPLLHRLSGYEIELPPLRDRRDDVGRLLVHFLREELTEIGELDKLRDPGPRGEPWLSASLVSRLAHHDWPGNVRQLRNVASQLVIASRGHEKVRVSPQLERLLQEPGLPEPARRNDTAVGRAGSRRRAGSRQYRDPDSVADDELVRVMRDNQWQVKDSAAELGVSRTSLYALIDRCALVRKASDLSRGEIEEAQKRCGGSLDAMVDRLEVSKKALKMRMKEVGLR